MLKCALLLAAASSISAYLSANCFYYFPNQSAVYDFKSLKNRADDTIKTEGATLVFNFCKEVKLPPQCANFFSSAFGYRLTAEGHCAKILSADPILDTVTVTSSEGVQGLRRKSLGSPITFEFLCKNDQAEPIVEHKGSTVFVTTRDACAQPFRTTRAVKIAWSVVLGVGMACGLFLAFFGGYLWNKILGVVGFVLGAGTAALVLGAFVASEEGGIPWYAFIVFFLLVVLSGAAAAYIFIVNALLASVTAGLGFGVAISIGIFHLVGAQTTWIVVSCHMTLGLLGAFLSLYCIKWILAITTAVSGSLLFTLSLCALLQTLKGMPRFLSFLRADAGRRALPAAYIVVMAVLALAGMIAQFALIARSPAKKNPGSLAHICS